VFRISKQQRWFFVAGLAGMAASHLTEQAVSASWRLAAGKDPPEDPSYRDVDWGSALLFAAATGAVVAVSEVLAVHAAGIGWKKTTGRRAPRPRRRSKHR
jgi:hypothetical protein